ncbi:MAG: hypothetical protein PHH60_04245 [Candidatus Margulisbacteria bacterium]|nr:hypothetical protein [Candidatus Margulisiibacteriota bacterium]
MLTFVASMAEETLKQIKAIETTAEELVRHAHQESLLSVGRIHEKHKQDLQTLEQALRHKGEEGLRAVEISAQKEAEAISAGSLKEIEDLNKKSQTVFASAKKEILRWLS